MAISWNGWYWHLGLASFIAMGGAIAAKSDCAHAQVTPDGTLGAESSVVTPTNVNGVPGNQIDGGAARGANLFHSFDEFSVPTGGEAFFNNALDIQNIISRVTGGSISNIDGLLRANGTANLFLLNPNGIIFGSNASLNIGGSFLGSTASSLNFADGTQFSTTAPQTTPLLTVSVPLGLQYGGTAGSILNQSRATNSSGELVGLQIQPGKTLALVGGDVSLEGGILLAPGGRIELGGVAGAGSVGLNVDDNNLRLSFPVGVQLSDVFLSNAAEVNVRAGGDGSIAINGQNLNLAAGSQLWAGIDSELGSIDSQAGNIEINTTGTINLTNKSFIANRVERRAIGKGGDINITTEALSVTSGAQLSASTFGQGNAGSMNINARDTVSFDGVSSEGFNSTALSTVGTRAIGNGGSINITTGSLFVTNGAGISGSTFGQGSAGNVNINARDIVSFDGVSSDRAASGVLSNVVSGAVGRGGSINITTGSLFVTKGAQLQAVTQGQGDAGNLTINARDTVSFDGERESKGEFFSSAAFNSVRTGAIGKGGSINITTGSLAVTNGALLSVTTSGQGDAGSVNINARDIVSFSGISSSEFSSGAASTVNSGAVGNGGGINISTRLLSVTNDALLSASSEGNGAAGNIEVAAHSIRLGNQALLRSETIAGQGNIELRSEDLVLRRGSNITTNATGTASGGNINIDSDVIAALENSDISADSANSLGGRVRINTQRIFGAEFRLNPTLESDITATGGSPELIGTVEINTPDVDPSQGLVNLPTVPIDTEVVQACQPGGSEAQSEFVITGRGGLPPNPGDALSTDAVMVDLITLNPETENRSSAAPSTNSTIESAPTQIVEANGWVKGPNGEVTLVASAPTANLDIPWLPKSRCNAPEPES